MRSMMAESLGAEPATLYLGGTESDNIAVIGGRSPAQGDVPVHPTEMEHRHLRGVQRSGTEGARSPTEAGLFGSIDPRAVAEAADSKTRRSASCM